MASAAGTGPRLFLVAGELSGDRLGAGLMEGLRARAPATSFAGLGGPLMQRNGLDPLFDISEIAVMGLVEVLPRLRRLLRRIDQTAQAAIAAQPDALVTIDSPDFGLRVAAKLRAARPEIPIIHYVAPSVWAWRPGRAQRMARHVDHVLALLPFEPPYMTAAGMGCDFVGHPAALLAPPAPDACAAFRVELGLGAGNPPGVRPQGAPWNGPGGDPGNGPEDPPAEAPLLCVLPGSRRGEVARHMPLFGAALARLAPRFPGLQVVLPAAAFVADQVAAACADWPVPVTLLDPRGRPADLAEARKLTAFAAADAALAASGTVVLELAAMRCPMVAAYRVNHLTSLIVRHIVKVNTANLVNLLTDSRAVPEFLQEYATPDTLADALAPLLAHAPARAAQVEALDLAMSRIGRGGPSPSLRAADAVLACLAGRAGRAAQAPQLRS
ncbi:MAG: lipid-A-disaccharide synthase [Pseudomonadota bacterium]